MLDRPKLTRHAKAQDEEEQRPQGQARSTEERFHLRVDGQMKRSFPTKQAALTAGSVIKKNFPIVAVTVLDSQDSSTEVVGG